MSNKVASEISRLEEVVGKYERDIKRHYLEKAKKEIMQVDSRAKKYIEALKVESINASMNGGNAAVLSDNESVMFRINHNEEGELEISGGLLNENKLKMSVDQHLAHELVWIHVESENLDLTNPLVFRNISISYRYDKSIVRHYGLKDLQQTSRLQ